MVDNVNILDGIHIVNMQKTSGYLQLLVDTSGGNMMNLVGMVDKVKVIDKVNIVDSIDIYRRLLVT